MAATFDDLVEEILGNLQGYTLTQDLVTSLSASLDATSTTVKIDMPEGGVGIGLLEIGDELVYVKSVDEDAGTLNLLPKGRGWRGTTATTHASGDTVVVSPLVPRVRVKAAINDTITSLYPAVFGVGTTEFTWTASNKVAWEIPAEAEQILDVRWKDALGNWVKVRCWELVRSADTADFPSGCALRITESLMSGRQVQVVYGKRPSVLTTTTADFTTTGLPASAKDLITLGTMARLIPAMDAGRLGVQYVSADELDQPRQMGSATALAREYERGFQQALAREQAALQRLYPGRPHYVSAN